jgi:predicted nucleic acid-binding protein
MTVFVDTSALYAVLDADDEEHASAKDTWVALLENRDGLQTDNYVLVETLALLQSRLGMPAVHKFTTDILPVLNIFWVDEGVHRSAHHALLVSARRRLSLVDCVGFEVMRRLHLDTVFCFDLHFAEQGFRVLPE